MSQYVPQTDNPVGSHVLLIDPRASVSALLACAEQRIQAAKNLLRCLSLMSGHSHDPKDLRAIFRHKKPRRAYAVRGCESPMIYNLAMDTSVDFTNAITSLPTTSSSSLTERVVITEVTMPDAVCTSISDSTSPSTISLMWPLNWLRTLMALMVMVSIPVLG